MQHITRQIYLPLNHPSAAMKEHFIKLFNYDRFANLLILNSIIEAHEPLKAVQLMGHLLAAQQIWLQRCKQLPTTGVALWPDWTAIEFKAIIESNHAEWISFLEQAGESEFSSMIVYKNSKGDNFQNNLSDILAHLINHGAHHRAQIGQELKFSGLDKLPVTDYIFYLREQKV